MKGIEYTASPERIDFFVTNPRLSKLIFSALVVVEDDYDADEVERLFLENEIRTEEISPKEIIFTHQDAPLIQKYLGFYADAERHGGIKARKRSELAIDTALYIANVIEGAGIPSSS